MRPASSLIFALTTLVTCSAFLGCGIGGSGGMAKYGSGSNGSNFQRSVKYKVAGPGDISTQGNIATIQFAKGKLVIEEARILLDNKELATIPADAKSIDVNYARSRLTITVDGKQVYDK